MSVIKIFIIVTIHLSFNRYIGQNPQRLTEHKKLYQSITFSDLSIKSYSFL